MREQTTQNTTQRHQQSSEAQLATAATDAAHHTAPTPPGPSRPQTMLYGIVGEKLEQITRHVPLDEPPPLPENAKLSAIGASIPRFDAVQKVTGRAACSA